MFRKAQECLLQQKTEECAQISEILEHAEGEVLLGREKTIELEKLNAELDHKNTQVRVGSSCTSLAVSYIQIGFLQ